MMSYLSSAVRTGQEAGGLPFVLVGQLRVDPRVRGPRVAGPDGFRRVVDVIHVLAQI